MFVCLRECICLCVCVSVYVCVFFRTNVSHYIHVLPYFDAAWIANTAGCSLLY